jgi:hypothetical protein
VLLGKSVVPIWKEPVVKAISNLCNPGIVKVVKNSSGDPGPIMYGHAGISLKAT